MIRRMHSRGVAGPRTGLSNLNDPGCWQALGYLNPGGLLTGAARNFKP